MQHSAELERNSFAPVTLLICWNITTPHFVCSPFMSGSRLRRQEEGWGAPLVWGWGASFGAKPRHRHHRHIGTGCLGPRAPSVLVVRVLSGAVPSSKTHTVPLSSFVRRSNLMFQLYLCVPLNVDIRHRTKSSFWKLPTLYWKGAGGWSLWRRPCPAANIPTTGDIDSQ